MVLDHPHTKTRCSFNFKPIIRDQENIISFYTKQNSHVPKKKEPKKPETKTLVLTVTFSTLISGQNATDQKIK